MERGSSLNVINRFKKEQLVRTRTKVEQAKQPNGIEEILNPEKRAEAEAYYTSKGVGSTADERYHHFRDDPYLGPAFYYNFNYSPASEERVSRLALLEWARWQWDGSF